MRPILFLADSAQVADGKVHVLGGGWENTTGGVAWAIAGFVDVPWADANAPHALDFELFTTDEPEKLVSIPTPMGEQSFKVTVEFEIGRPPGSTRGAPLRVPIAVNLPPIPIGVGRYQIRVSIDGVRKQDADMTFSVIQIGQQPRPPQ